MRGSPEVARGLFGGYDQNPIAREQGEQAMRLTSTDFSDDGRIPTVCTCEGEDASPALQWIDAPPATRSFVLLCNDPDAPDGVWRHWAAYDIPHAWSRLARGPDAHRARASQARDQRFRQCGVSRPMSAERRRVASLPLQPARALGRQARRPRRSALPGCGTGGPRAFLAEATLGGLFDR